MKSLFFKKKPLGPLVSKFFSSLRNFIRKIKIFVRGNYFIINKNSYVGDGLASNHVVDFLKEEKFINSYNEGEKTGALNNHPTGIHYRAYIACYFAKHALNLEGDFVECGVGKGLLAKTISVYLNFEKLNKKFYLFDTYQGIPVTQAQTEKEKELMKWLNDTIYTSKDYFNEVSNTFLNYKNIKLIKGLIPNCLNDVQIEKVSFISIDLNNAFAEIKAIEFFWNKLVSYGVVLLDDYAYSESYRLQKSSWDKFAKSKNLEILTLPTGQGLLIKN